MLNMTYEWCNLIASSAIWSSERLSGSDTSIEFTCFPAWSCNTKYSVAIIRPNWSTFSAPKIGLLTSRLAFTVAVDSMEYSARLCCDSMAIEFGLKFGAIDSEDDVSTVFYYKIYT